jgi:hypothetical protein
MKSYFEDKTCCYPTTYAHVCEPFGIMIEVNYK